MDKIIAMLVARLMVLLQLWGLFVNLPCNADELPWLVKPVPVVNDGPNPTTFPTVKGLKLDTLATLTDPQRQDTTAVHLFFDQPQYANLSQLMKTDPAFAAGWDRLVRMMRSMMADDGQGQLQEVEPERYVYTLGGRLLNAALYYRLCGDPQAGAFLKAITLDTAQRPMSFWMHKALRKYKDDWPVGQLETAILARGMSVALVWGHDLYSESERQLITNALRDKGLYPMLRYLQTREHHNNFLPAIASGAMCAAVALDDALAIEHSLALLNKWGALIEDDGSYGEQIDYFNYACVNFAKGQMVLGRDHFLNVGKQLPQLAGALTWQLAHYSINEKNKAVRLNFGDDDFDGGPPSRLTTQFLALVTGNGLGTWMQEHLRGDKQEDDAYSLIAKLVLAGADMPDALPPTSLPTTLGYDTGIGIIRSSWTMDRDTVLAIRSGGATRTRYSHDHPNRNAIAMMFHGEYQIVEPGRASYRSKIRQTYDLSTQHHNTVTLSGSNQTRDRVAQLLSASEHGDALSVLVSEAAQSYKENPKHVRRSVYYLRQMDAFVIWDVVKVKTPQTIELNWHFGNDELKSTFSPISDGHWQLIKPRTQLDSFVFADMPLSSQQNEGIMHMNYSYFPGDPNEGQWGNAFELQLSSAKAETSASFVSVFVPQDRKGALPVDVRFISANNGVMALRLVRGEQTSEFQLDSSAMDQPEQVAAQIAGLKLNAGGKVLGASSGK